MPAEYYRDLLEIDSWINGRTTGVQANSLLYAQLQSREREIRERVTYLARKRGINPNDLWAQILRGEAEPLESGDLPADKVDGLIFPVEEDG